MSKYVLAIDQGTTSSRAVVFDHQMNPLGSASRVFEQHYPHNGWVEHDPSDLVGSVMESIAEVMGKLKISPRDLSAVGITNQRETTLVWDRKTGIPVYPAIVWQCRRSAELCEKLKADGLGEYVQKTTGLLIDAYFSATKIKWILDNVPGARQRAEAGELLFGTVDSFLIWKLSGGQTHVSDYTNASRTMLFNIHTLDWDERLLQVLGIPRSMMPRVVPSSGVCATCDHDGLDRLPIPIAGIAGDQQAALYGQHCHAAGQMKITYGTGAFLLLNIGNQPLQSRHGLVTTLTAGTQPGAPEYALEGSVFMAGAIMQWLRDELGILPDAGETGAIAASVPDSGGVCLVPAFVGLGAPYWDMYARAAIVGMSRGTNRKHIIRAAEEAIAYQCADLISAMKSDTGGKVQMARVDGGAARDNFLLQFQADVLDCKIERPSYAETTVAGAAELALRAVDPQACVQEAGGVDRFEPRIDPQKREKLLEMWKRAVRQVQAQ